MTSSLVLGRLNEMVKLDIASSATRGPVHDINSLVNFLIVLRVNIASGRHDTIRSIASPLRILSVVGRGSTCLVQVSIALASWSNSVLGNSLSYGLVVLAENGQHVVVRVILRHRVSSSHRSPPLNLARAIRINLVLRGVDGLCIPTVRSRLASAMCSLVHRRIRLGDHNIRSKSISFLSCLVHTSNIVSTVISKFILDVFRN